MKRKVSFTWAKDLIEGVNLELSFKEMSPWGLRDQCVLHVKLVSWHSSEEVESRWAVEQFALCLCPDPLNSRFTFCEPQLSHLELG